MQTKLKFILKKLLAYNLVDIHTKCYMKQKIYYMKNMAVAPCTIVQMKKKNLTKMVNVYGLSVSVQKEEIHYLSPPLPTTTTIIAPNTIMDIFGLSFYCKEKPQENRNKNKRRENAKEHKTKKKRNKKNTKKTKSNKKSKQTRFQEEKIKNNKTSFQEEEEKARKQTFKKEKKKKQENKLSRRKKESKKTNSQEEKKKRTRNIKRS
jgi:flagellar biosynthesis GTPase FlhF